MKSPDENSLLKEILASEKLAEARRASLDGALALIERRRRTRRALQVASVLVLAGIGIAGFVFSKPTQVEIAANPPSRIETIPGPRSENKVQTITDEELFALFPGRAVALVGKPGHQELVFLDVPKPDVPQQ